MSRVGNKVINLVNGVKVTVSDNNHVVVEGPKGKLEYTFNPNMKIEVNGTEVKVLRPNDSIEMKTVHGTTRALLHNMIVGVSEGFEKAMHIEGVGYKAALQGNVLVVSAGYSHVVNMPLPEHVTIDLQSPTDFIIKGIDKQVVGQYAAEIRAIRKPEPYKGKGIRYKDEFVRRKEGKKAK